MAGHTAIPSLVGGWRSITELRPRLWKIRQRIAWVRRYGRGVKSQTFKVITDISIYNAVWLEDDDGETIIISPVQLLP